MDLSPSDDELVVTETIARFLADRFPLDVVRASATPGGFDRARWKELAALGTFALALPEDRGGVGLGIAAAVLVHEALGRALTPGPLVAASVLADLLPGVADGSVLGTIVRRPAAGPAVVEHLGNADVLVVLDDESMTLVDAPSLRASHVGRPIDPTVPIALVDELPDGERIGGPNDVQRANLVGSLLASAQLVGIAAESTDLACEHAKSRFQFDRPIGSFQGIKHLLADALARTEIARSATWSAGVSLDEADHDVARAVASSRVLAARAARENTRTCVAVHGGMGFTWEADPHLFFKRAIVLEATLGSSREAAEIVAADLMGARCQ